MAVLLKALEEQSQHLRSPLQLPEKKLIETNPNHVTKVGVLPIWIVKSNILSVGPTSERNRRNIRLYYPYRQYTNLFIFRFVSLLCLCSKQCLLHSMWAITLKIFSMHFKSVQRTC